MTHVFPNPAQVPSATLHAELCQTGRVEIWVYNTALVRVASFDLPGQAGSNDLPLDLTGFSHGVYYYLLRSHGPLGLHKSPIEKFVVVQP